MELKLYYYTETTTSITAPAAQKPSEISDEFSWLDVRRMGWVKQTTTTRRVKTGRLNAGTTSTLNDLIPVNVLKLGLIISRFWGPVLTYYSLTMKGEKCNTKSEPE